MAAIQTSTKDYIPVINGTDSVFTMSTNAIDVRAVSKNYDVPSLTKDTRIICTASGIRISFSDTIANTPGVEVTIIPQAGSVSVSTPTNGTITLNKNMPLKYIFTGSNWICSSYAIFA